MDKLEGQDDLDRCFIWDTVYRNGPQPLDIFRANGISKPRTAMLTNHKWFKIVNEKVRIAYT